jgi:hypothetical protein
MGINRVIQQERMLDVELRLESLENVVQVVKGHDIVLIMPRFFKPTARIADLLVPQAHTQGTRTHISFLLSVRFSPSGSDPRDGN